MATPGKEFDESQGQETEGKSAFDDDSILPAILITLTRIYDAQMAMLGALDGEAAMALERAHSAGMLLSPPPAFLGE